MYTIDRKIWKEIIANGVAGDYNLKSIGCNSDTWELVERNQHDVIRTNLTLNQAHELSIKLINERAS